MAKQVGSATASGSVAGSGSGAVSSRTTGSDGTAGGEQVAPFVSQVPGTPVSFPTFHGRPVSWVAVSMIMFAFLVGGLALVFLIWWLFWVAVGVAVLGLLLAASTGIFEDWY